MIKRHKERRYNWVNIFFPKSIMLFLYKLIMQLQTSYSVDKLDVKKMIQPPVSSFNVYRVLYHVLVKID